MKHLLMILLVAFGFSTIMPESSNAASFSPVLVAAPAKAASFTPVVIKSGAKHKKKVHKHRVRKHRKIRRVLRLR